MGALVLDVLIAGIEPRTGGILLLILGAILALFATYLEGKRRAHGDEQLAVVEVLLLLLAALCAFLARKLL